MGGFLADRFILYSKKVVCIFRPICANSVIMALYAKKWGERNAKGCTVSAIFQQFSTEWRDAPVCVCVIGIKDDEAEAMALREWKDKWMVVSFLRWMQALHGYAYTRIYSWVHAWNAKVAANFSEATSLRSHGIVAWLFSTLRMRSFFNCLSTCIYLTSFFRFSLNLCCIFIRFGKKSDCAQK